MLKFGKSDPDAALIDDDEDLDAGMQAYLARLAAAGEDPEYLKQAAAEAEMAKAVEAARDWTFKEIEAAELQAKIDRVKVDATPTGTRLRLIRDGLAELGRNTLEDALKIGELLEKAFKILEGRFTTWVRHECGIDPKTALGYRDLYKTFGTGRYSLGHLHEARIHPSAAMILASAPDAVIERVLSVARLSEVRFTCNRIREEVRTHRLARAQAGRKARTRSPREIATAEVKRIVGAISQKAIDRFAELGNSPVGRAEILEAVRAAATAALEAEASKDHMTREAAVPLETPPHTPIGPTVVEICAGAGGMAYGLERAGFKHLKLIEKNATACESLLTNGFSSDAVLEINVRKFRWENHKDDNDGASVDLLAGGPPCQPFSVAGKQEGKYDRRDLFKEAIRLVHEINPKAFFFENVLGFTQSQFAEYRCQIIDALEGSGYQVMLATMHGPLFGLAQLRRRVAIVGLKPEYAPYFRWPTLENPCVRLSIVDVLDEWVRKTGHPRAAAWADEHTTKHWFYPCLQIFRVETTYGPTVVAGSGSDEANLTTMGKEGMWGALGFDTSKVQTYDELLSPSATPMDANKIPITPEMIAALQGFPPTWQFEGGKGRQRHQIGNAVPPVFGQWIGLCIRAALEKKFIDEPISALRHRYAGQYRTKYISLPPGSPHSGLGTPIGTEPNPEWQRPDGPRATESLLTEAEVESLGFSMPSDAARANLPAKQNLL